MANEIRIESSTTKLTRGQPVLVSVRLVVETALKVRGLHAKFWGAEETKAIYTTTTTDSKGHVKRHTHTAVQHENIVLNEKLLLGNEKLGMLGNMSDGVATLFGGGKHQLLQPGEYPFEIEVLVPADAPGTHGGEKSRVFYELTVHADIPLGVDLTAKQAFEVDLAPVAVPELQPVRTKYPEDAGSGYFSSMFSPDVSIEMALAADHFRLGDPIDGFVVINATKPLKCDVLRVRLVAVEKSRARNHNDEHVHQTVAVELARPGVIEGSMSHEFAITAETSAPVSLRGHNFSIEWFVQLELDVPWAKDPTVRAPIVLLPA